MKPLRPAQAQEIPLTDNPDVLPVVTFNESGSSLHYLPVPKTERPNPTATQTTHVKPIAALLYGLAEDAMQQLVKFASTDDEAPANPELS